MDLFVKKRELFNIENFTVLIALTVYAGISTMIFKHLFDI